MAAKIGRKRDRGVKAWRRNKMYRGVKAWRHIESE
jgi:hypothetical protein